MGERQYLIGLGPPRRILRASGIPREQWPADSYHKNTRS